MALTLIQAVMIIVIESNHMIGLIAANVIGSDYKGFHAIDPIKNAELEWNLFTNVDSIDTNLLILILSTPVSK